MTKAVLFRPKLERDAEQNLVEFIEFCRDRLTVFGRDLDWKAMSWDLTDHVGWTGYKHRFRIVWSRTPDRPRVQGEPLDPEFGEFARAHFRYLFGLKPIKGFNTRLIAYRCLEEALLKAKSSGSIHALDALVCNHAAGLAKRYSSELGYRLGNEIQRLSKFVNDLALVTRPFEWKNPIRRPVSGDRIGPERERRAKKCLPMYGAMEALAEAFNRAREPRDVIVTSMAALLLGTNSRISELHRINAYDCEVFHDHAGEERYGLRWKPSKGADYDVRWIPTAFVPIVQKALANIREHTEDARRLAALFEDDPEHVPFLLSPDCVGAVDFVRVASLEGQIAAAGNAYEYLKNKNARLFKSQQGDWRVARTELNQVVRGSLPPDFPIADRETGLKYRDALLTVRSSYLHRRFESQKWRVGYVASATFYNDLGNNRDRDSVFDRLGIRASDGEPIKIRAHQIRHLLTTVAVEGGLSQIDIARWAGRADIRHNDVYDHSTQKGVIAKAREIDANNEMISGLVTVTPQGPVTVRDVLRGDLAGVHQTEFGVCLHDFAAAPCMRHRDCLNCFEHACIKGDPEAERALRERLALAQDGLDRADAADADGDYGAGRWSDHQRRTIERLRDLVSRLDDPELPVGSIIRLSGPDDAVQASINLHRRLKAPSDDNARQSE